MADLPELVPPFHREDVAKELIRRLSHEKLPLERDTEDDDLVLFAMHELLAALERRERRLDG